MKISVVLKWAAAFASVADASPLVVNLGSNTLLSLGAGTTTNRASTATTPAATTRVASVGAAASAAGNAGASVGTNGVGVSASVCPCVSAALTAGTNAANLGILPTRFVLTHDFFFSPSHLGLMIVQQRHPP